MMNFQNLRSSSKLNILNLFRIKDKLKYKKNNKKNKIFNQNNKIAKLT